MPCVCSVCMLRPRPRSPLRYLRFACVAAQALVLLRAQHAVRTPASTPGQSGSSVAASPWQTLPNPQSGCLWPLSLQGSSPGAAWVQLTPCQAALAAAPGADCSRSGSGKSRRECINVTHFYDENTAPGVVQCLIPILSCSSLIPIPHFWGGCPRCSLHLCCCVGGGANSWAQGSALHPAGQSPCLEERIPESWFCPLDCMRIVCQPLFESERRDCLQQEWQLSL